MHDDLVVSALVCLLSGLHAADNAHAVLRVDMETSRLTVLSSVF